MRTAAYAHFAGSRTRPGCAKNLTAGGDKPASALEMLDRPTKTASQIEQPCADASACPPRDRAAALLDAGAVPSRAASGSSGRPICFTSWAFEMETLILGWYVLVETGSVLWLTVFGALQYLGTLVAPMMGVASDRIGHRNVLCGMRAIYAVLACALMAARLRGRGDAGDRAGHRDAERASCDRPTSACAPRWSPRPCRPIG